MTLATTGVAAINIFNVTVPFAWAEALRTVQTVHPEAVLAGGCLRDLILGGQVKDLDIFVGPASTNLQEVLTLRHGWRLVMSVNADYVDSMRGEVVRVHGYCVPGFPLEIQIIQLTRLDEPHDAIQRMDFAACQVGFISPTHWVYTPEALKDFMQRTITMLEPDDHVQECRSLARADRFAAKYAGTDVRVVPIGLTTRIGESFNMAFAPWEDMELEHL